MCKSEIIKLLYEVICEDPGTVLGTEKQGELASFDDPGTVAFIVIDIWNEPQIFYYDGRPNRQASHDHVWAKIIDKYPQKKVWKTGVEVQGRIWPDKKLCSIYEDEVEYRRYSGMIEQMFKELKLDINMFLFEYGESAMEGGLYPWSKFAGGKKPLSRSPEAEEAKIKLSQILMNFHLADPVKKIELRKEMERLRKIMGATEDDLNSMIKIANDKTAEIEKKYGSVAQSNYMKGSIAEEKVRLYHDHLDPMIFPPKLGGKLCPDIRKNLLIIADDFYKDKELKSPLYDVYLVGSLAGLSYNQESDVDLHLVVDMKAMGIPENYIKQFGKGLSSKWNDEHDVKIHGHKVEIYVQDVHAELHSNGIYSLCKDQWIKTPQNLKPQLDKESIKNTYHEFVKGIDDSIASRDVQLMKNVFNQIMDLRKQGLDSGGEYSTKNLVFKLLRSKGHIDRLKEFMNDEFDKKLSLSELTISPTSKSEFHPLSFGSAYTPKSLKFSVDGKVFEILFTIMSDAEDMAEFFEDFRRYDWLNPADRDSQIETENDLAEFLRRNDVWHIEFKRLSSSDTPDFDKSGGTGLKGDMAHKSQHVYSKVLSSVLGFINEVKPDYLVAIAPDTQRKKIYTLFGQKFASLGNMERVYQILGMEVDDDVFVFRNKKNLQESMDNPKDLVIGFTTDDLEIMSGTYDKIHGHDSFRGYSFEDDSGNWPWRYRKDLNKLYWWNNAPSNIRYATRDYLKRKHGANNPLEVRMKLSPEFAGSKTHFQSHGYINERG